MFEGIEIAGFFLLACTFHQVDPRLGTVTSEDRPASVTTLDGHGSMEGLEGADGQYNVSAYNMPDGTIQLLGITHHDSDAASWAVLKPDPEGRTFEAEWLIDARQEEDGRRSAKIWSRGRCERK